MILHGMVHSVLSGHRAVQRCQTDGYNHVYVDVLCMGYSVCTVSEFV